MMDFGLLHCRKRGLGKANGETCLHSQGCTCSCMNCQAARRIRELESWDDAPLPEDEAIQEAFPTRTGRHEIYGEAMRLVGASRSKGKLVALVNWLLAEQFRMRERDLLGHQTEGCDRPCTWCGKSTSMFAGDPSAWPIGLALDPEKPGHPSTYCLGCVHERVRGPRELRLPDADGWWARRYGKEVKWFRVDMTSETGNPPLEPHIYVKDFGTMELAARFSSPTTRWFGPFKVPKDD